MKLQYHHQQQILMSNSSTWLITGVAGFIGSNLLEALLNLNQHVVGLDNFSTGYRANLNEVRANVSPEQWRRFRLIEGDIRNFEHCYQASTEVDYILHQAALGSVPRSIDDPITTNQVNIDGFLNMLTAARDNGVQRFIYAASSSTYGDHKALPKVEDCIGKPLSPYAVTKYVNELYAEVFHNTYGVQSVGLRYFNVFGQRRDLNGAYAAVIPKWIARMIRGETVYINGDGETSRDFCYIDNAVQANILAATAQADAVNQVYNIAAGESTTLNQLFGYLQAGLVNNRPGLMKERPVYRDFRTGDVRHSLADIVKAKHLLGYTLTHSISEGLLATLHWYEKHV